MTDTTIEPFLHNAWYVAAWPHEVENGPIGRTILNQQIVLFRDSSGNTGALEDRCCHRGAPLAKGRVTEKGLQCGYHGLVFDRTGRCVEVPGQDAIPEAARVRDYPVVERQQFIWIWMGDPAQAAESAIPDYPFHDQPHRWPHRKERMHIRCNYMMLIDNLMDLTHLAYVHARTVGADPKATVNAEMNIVKTSTGLKYIRWMPNSNPPPTYVRGAGFKDRIDRWQEFEYILPGNVIQWTGALDVGKGARANREQDGFHLRIFHGITPETVSSCHYFWSAANGYRQDDPAATEQMYNEIYPTFVEDIAILEGQQSRVERDPGRQLVGIRADAALMQARRALRHAIEAERQARAQAAE
jgi:phenylpropionate dioxygenase-like ring-hydroxylating dioxygenase large terminal subunit